MAHFHIAIEKPVEIVPRLGKQELHWKEGRSAYELATTWMRAGGIPKAVRTVLEQAPEWRGAQLLDGVFERETAMPGDGRPSQTDLLGIVSLKDGNAILGVEGKVDESFGPIVERWLEGEAKTKKPKTKEEEKRAKEERLRSQKNRKLRLGRLCETLNVNAPSVGKLYYQLFHRTCAVIFEAQRFRYPRAVMFVHSFAPTVPRGWPAGFAEFSAFGDAVDMPIPKPGTISPPRHIEGIEVRLAWASDQPSIQTQATAVPSPKGAS
jgi:hypothetical protein